MARPASARVLIVAYRTAATPLLLNAVRARAARSACAFTLLVPRPYWDPDTEEAEATLELAIPLLEEAAGGHVAGLIGDSDPFVAVREAVTSIGIDEILISTLPVPVSRWRSRTCATRASSTRAARSLPSMTPSNVWSVAPPCWATRRSPATSSSVPQREPAWVSWRTARKRRWSCSARTTGPPPVT